MCMVCKEWQRGFMTVKEVDRALAEMITEDSSEEELKHAQEVLEKALYETT